MALLILIACGAFVAGALAGFAHLSYMSDRGGWIAGNGHVYKITRVDEGIHAP